MNPFLTTAQVEELETMGFIELTDELMSQIFGTSKVTWEDDILITE